MKNLSKLLVAVVMLVVLSVNVFVLMGSPEAKVIGEVPGILVVPTSNPSGMYCMCPHSIGECRCGK